MMSPTVMCSIRLASSPWTTAWAAAWCRKNASSSVSTRGPRSVPNRPTRPSRPSSRAKAWPARPVISVARLRSPVRHQIDRPGDPPAVEREGGDDVEQQQGAVDERQPAHQRERRGRGRAFADQGRVAEARAAGEQHPEREAEGEQPERHQRPGDGHLELLGGALGLAAHVQQPAEEPQVDAHHRDPDPAGGERVAELVQDQREEVPERARDGDRVGGRLRAADDFVEAAREPVDQEEQDEQPASAGPHANPEDARQLQVPSPRHQLNGRPDGRPPAAAMRPRGCAR